MNVYEGFQFINFRANKSQTGRSYTLDNYNLGLKAVDIEWLKTKYGLPEQYRPGMPMPSQAWEVTQKISDDLRHLKVLMGGRNKPLMSVDQYGFASIPPDYIHVSTIRYDKTANTADCGTASEDTSIPIEVLKDADFDARLNSCIKNNFGKYPICRFETDYIEFRPKSLRFVLFGYLRLPTSAFLSATYDANNNLVYDAATSTQLDWPEDMHTDIFNTLYNWLAVNLKDQVGIQDSQSRKILGQ